MSRQLSCVEWVRKTTKSIGDLPFIGDAKAWIESDLLTRIEPDDVDKYKDVICVLPGFGVYGHMVKIFEVTKIKDISILEGAQNIGPQVAKFRQVYNSDKHYLLIAKGQNDVEGDKKDGENSKKSSHKPNKKSVQVKTLSPEYTIDVKRTTVTKRQISVNPDQSPTPPKKEAAPGVKVGHKQNREGKSSSKKGVKK